MEQKLYNFYIFVIYESFYLFAWQDFIYFFRLSAWQDFITFLGKCFLIWKNV